MILNLLYIVCMPLLYMPYKVSSLYKQQSFGNLRYILVLLFFIYGLHYEPIGTGSDAYSLVRNIEVSTFKVDKINFDFLDDLVVVLCRMINLPYQVAFGLYGAAYGFALGILLELVLNKEDRVPKKSLQFSLISMLLMTILISPNHAINQRFWIASLLFFSTVIWTAQGKSLRGMLLLSVMAVMIHFSMVLPIVMFRLCYYVLKLKCRYALLALLSVLLLTTFYNGLTPGLSESFFTLRYASYTSDEFGFREGFLNRTWYAAFWHVIGHISTIVTLLLVSFRNLSDEKKVLLRCVMFFGIIILYFYNFSMIHRFMQLYIGLGFVLLAYTYDDKAANVYLPLVTLMVGASLGIVICVKFIFETTGYTALFTPLLILRNV